MRNFNICGAVVAGLAGAILVASPVMAQTKGSAATRDYVAAAGQSDAFEMMEASTVLAQSSDPQARTFAQQMLRDHTKLDGDLRAAVARSGLEPPPMGAGADQAPLLASLQSLNGPDFDKAYWRDQALAHRSALVTTQLYAARGDSAAIRKAASDAVPIIAAHLAMAEQMAAKTGGV